MGYLKVHEIDKRIDALAANTNYSGLVSVFNLNHKTADKKKHVKCLKIGKGSFPVLIIGGIHAREWAPPDALVSLAEKLLEAYHKKKNFVDKRFEMKNPDLDSMNDGTYTGKIVFNRATFPKGSVEKIIDRLEIYIVPCVNRDGREFSLASSNLENKNWRTNRKKLGSSCPTGPAPIGVDLNRNFPVAWDMKKHYNASALPTAMSGTSDNKCDPSLGKRKLYQGPVTLSEPETRNIKELIDAKKIKVFLDVHSYAREVTYPWSINYNQTTDPYQTFHNDKWDNPPKGRPINGVGYKEYFPEKSGHELLKQHDTLANHMKNSIFKAAGTDPHAKKRSNYKARQSFYMYPTPGASDDYAFSTQLEKDPTADPAKGHKAKIKDILFPVYAFTMESGHDSDGQFWPSQDPNKNQFRKIQREIHFAVLELLAYAAKWAAPAVSRQGCSGCKDCFIATAVYGSEHHPHVEFLRTFRDVDMQASELGKKVMAKLMKLYYQFSPQAAAYLERHQHVGRVVRRFVVSPIVSLLKGYTRIIRPVTSPTLRTKLLIGLIGLSGLGAILALAGIGYLLISCLTG